MWLCPTALGLVAPMHRWCFPGIKSSKYKSEDFHPRLNITIQPPTSKPHLKGTNTQHQTKRPNLQKNQHQDRQQTIKPPDIKPRLPNRAWACPSPASTRHNHPKKEADPAHNHQDPKKPWSFHVCSLDPGVVAPGDTDWQSHGRRRLGAASLISGS